MTGATGSTGTVAATGGTGISEDYLAGFTVLLAEVSATGRRLTREELDERRAVGERTAEQGHKLGQVVTAHLAAARESWPALPGTAEAPTARAVTAVASGVLDAIGQAVSAVCEGYERAQRLAVRQEEAIRREFIDDLLYGRSDLNRLAERAERFGLRLAHEHAVAVASGPETYDDTHPVTRRVETALVARFEARRVLMATKEGKLVCVAPGSQSDTLAYFAEQARIAMGGGRVAVGRAHPGAGGVVHSYEESLNALDLAERMPLHGEVLHAADLLVFPVLTRDRQAMADLVRTALGPLRTARGGPKPLLDTLWEYFDSGCVAAEAARRLRLSVRALTYRLDRIKQLTGSDPADPLHRYMLHTAVIGAKLLDWPAQEL
ncbi:PucR family transcriptional regulator [Yinghuangia soli]|uniref:Helix-turn-helix domain-containing protein n=1 Tax=Yinghuangia soli TaxID=2908204 RepID=A0AA41Q7H5_9ACTN|nr:helix-turn-helix domain-containing protein [Yinghuangia soli]MCF2531597.1 helix-turn-helix domain-containing protein [Yinghuangia soli]